MLAIVRDTTPEPIFAAWLSTGHGLLSQRSDIEWKLADWLADGRERFGNQAEFDFLADELGIAPKRLKSAVKVAMLFPPHMRDASLTFDHHESVANLPATEALTVLKQAKDAHWDDRETRVEAVRRQAQIQPSLGQEVDWPYHCLMTLQRAWNRAEPATRRDFFDAITENDLGDLDL